MKRILIFLFLGTVAVQGGFSQDETEAQVSDGRITIDVNFNPSAFFDAAAGDMFVSPLIKGRYFIASDMAVRLGVGVGVGSNTTYTSLTEPDYNKTSSFSINLAPGIEKHFGSKRLFAFVGGELLISSLSTSAESLTAGTVAKSKNANGGYLSIGVNAIFGVDFYVFPNLFIGAEFTPGFSMTNYKDTTIDGTVTAKGGKSSSFGLNTASGLRIGVRF